MCPIKLMFKRFNPTFTGCNVTNHSKAAVQMLKMTFMVQQHHPCTKASPKRSNVGINHQGLICTSWFHWLCKKKMELGSHLNHMWCNKMNPCFSLAASHQITSIRVWKASSSIFTSWRGSRVECLCAVHLLDSSAQTIYVICSSSCLFCLYWWSYEWC